MPRIERANSFFNGNAHAGLRVVSLALLAASAYAGTITTGTTFNVSGGFDAGGLSSFGSSLGGTIDIDTVGGAGVIDGNLTVTPNPLPTGTAGSLTFNQFTPTNQQGLADSGDYYYVNFMDNSGDTLQLDLFLGNAGTPSPLDGYNGGPLCGDATTNGVGGLTACSSNAETSYALALADPNLNSGDVSNSPEPSSALLLFGGAALIAFGQRKRRG